MTRKRAVAGKQGRKGLAGSFNPSEAEVEEVNRRKAEVDAAHLATMAARSEPHHIQYVPPAARFATLAGGNGWRCGGNGYSVSEGG